jgi:hypothetical protein
MYENRTNLTTQELKKLLILIVENIEKVKMQSGFLNIQIEKMTKETEDDRFNLRVL